MDNRIYDGVLINLLQKGPTEGSLEDIARQFMGGESVSTRYKAIVRAASIEDLEPDDDTSLLDVDEQRRLFHWHYLPRIYKVFGYFDLAILQLCESVEIISELSTQPNVSATQNIFGLRTLTGPPENKGPCGGLEICSPLLPYICICNVKVHPLVQMVLGKDLQGLLNLHFEPYLDEVEVLRRSADPNSGADLITLTIVDTYGWNELTFLIHGSRFDRMLDFVVNDVRGLRLRDILKPANRLSLQARLDNLSTCLRGYGLTEGLTATTLLEIPLFSYTDTVPGLDYGLGQALRRAPLLVETDIGHFRKRMEKILRKRIDRNSDGQRYLLRVENSEIEPAIRRILDDVTQDDAGCFSIFSIRPGRELAFQESLRRAFGEVDDHGAEIVLGQHDFLLRQLQDDSALFPGRGLLLERVQKIIQMRHPWSPAESTRGEADPQRELLAGFQELIVSSKTAISSNVVLRTSGHPVSDPFHVVRQHLPRIFKFRRAAPEEAAVVLSECCNRIGLPRPLQTSLEHTLEPFYSFLQNPSLFSQYIDLFLPLLFIMQQIQRVAAGKVDDHRPTVDHISRELQLFNRAFHARFRASHLNTEATEATLEFKAHTVTPLDTIQCIIDSFIGAFIGLGEISGFPLISVSGRPTVRVSRVFSVELNAFQLLYPESLLVLFHEMGHLYLRYRRWPQSFHVKGASSLPRMLKVVDDQTRLRWSAFTSLLSAEEPANPVKAGHVAIQIEEILSDLLLLTSALRNDWDLYLWYVLFQMETRAEYFPEDTPTGDRGQIALYREVLMRHFLVQVFWRTGVSTSPEDWQREIDPDRFRSFADGLRSRSKKLRDFCVKNDADTLDALAWTLVTELVRPKESLVPAREDGKVVLFQDTRDFWAPRDDVRSHRGLPAMFMSLVFESYRRMLEDVVVQWILSYEDRELGDATPELEAVAGRLRRGELSMGELTGLLSRLVALDAIVPEVYLERLRVSPSQGWMEETFVEPQLAYARVYRRVTAALAALVRFFCDHNQAGEDDLRYLYRDPRTGDPEHFQKGRSDVETSPSFDGRHPPLPIVIDRLGVFFCRSTATRQQAFQYRNAVIRELADLHYKLRPLKMAEIQRIASAYREELQ